jgi:TetR/AcrR family transcriptional repressor of nem operon
MTSTTRLSLLAEAELLLRTKGYAAFSYADLAKKIDVRNASIHHHFPTKEHLGRAVVEKYLAEFSQQLREIETASESSMAKLRAYASFFGSVLESGQLPLCSALAAELKAMPESLQDLTRDFFDLHLKWLARTIRGGVANGEFRSETDPKRAAALMLSVLEGASLTTWVTGDGTIFRDAFEAAIASL